MKLIKCPSDVVSLLKDIYSGMEQEMLTVISLTGANTIIGVYPMSVGTDCQCLMSSKMIARRAVMDLAKSVILVHNHPSGLATPSQADIACTKNIRDALNLFDIHLADHIIYAEDKYFSFTEDTTHSITN